MNNNNPSKIAHHILKEKNEEHLLKLHYCGKGHLCYAEITIFSQDNCQQDS